VVASLSLFFNMHNTLSLHRSYHNAECQYDQTRPPSNFHRFKKKKNTQFTQACDTKLTKYINNTIHTAEKYSTIRYKKNLDNLGQPSLGGDRHAAGTTRDIVYAYRHLAIKKLQNSCSKPQQKIPPTLAMVRISDGTQVFSNRISAGASDYSVA
jgi:hypothetical protein